jgi:hypothetical protein
MSACPAGLCHAAVRQGFPVRYLDEAVEAVFLDAVQPAALQTMLEAFTVMERERLDVDRHWQLRIERARYEAERAQRQYDAVEPQNRSVARSLEARWNAALEALEKLQGEYAIMQRTDLLPLGEADRESVRRLAADLPAIWRAPTTTMVDRKRLLRLVMTEVTLTTQPEQRRAKFKVLWCGGAVSDHSAECPPIGAHQRTAAAALARLSEMRPSETWGSCGATEGTPRPALGGAVVPIQGAICHSGSDLQHQMGSSRRPAHLLVCAHPAMQ